jgi:hypothetical protein
VFFKMLLSRRLEGRSERRWEFYTTSMKVPAAV